MHKYKIGDMITSRQATTPNSNWIVGEIISLSLTDGKFIYSIIDRDKVIHHQVLEELVLTANNDT